MGRLTAYLVTLFFRHALAFAAVASVLIYLIQCLRLFDVVSVKGQALLTLLGQALLTLPPVIVGFLYVCFGIGLARALRELQLSHELHAIHASRRLPALVRGVALYSVGSALVVLVLANFIDPWSTRRLNDWSERIAADLVSRTLVPHRFSEVVPDVVIMIGGREGNGEITNFFADDRRDPAMRRTYVADSATIAASGDGYVINLRDGALQYTSADLDFSQIDFKSYDVAMERLTDPIEDKTSLSELDSVQIAADAMATGRLSPAGATRLEARLAEGTRALTMALLVGALAMFPSGKRRRVRLPLEILVLFAAFAERGISTYAPLSSHVQPFSGSIVLAVVTLLILSVRLRLFRRLPRLPSRLALPMAVPA